MHHFVVPPQAIKGDHIAFSPAQAHQMTRVLRLRDGAEVVALDGRGAQYRVRLESAAGSVSGLILGPATDCREPRLRISLLTAPPKGERWEWLLQKGTEVGVARFVPLVARYSQPGSAVVKPRHREIVREAVEQCRRLLVPPIEGPRPLSQSLREAASASGAASVLLWEGERERALAAALRPALERGVTDVRLVVGPEGGFHPDEVALARELGIVTASLGPLTLRAETAGLVAAAIALSLDEARDTTSAGH